MQKYWKLHKWNIYWRRMKMVISCLNNLTHSYPSIIWCIASSQTVTYCALPHAWLCCPTSSCCSTCPRCLTWSPCPTLQFVYSSSAACKSNRKFDLHNWEKQSERRKPDIYIGLQYAGRYGYSPPPKKKTSQKTFLLACMNFFVHTSVSVLFFNAPQ